MSISPKLSNNEKKQQKTLSIQKYHFYIISAKYIWKLLCPPALLGYSSSTLTCKSMLHGALKPQLSLCDPEVRVTTYPEQTDYVFTSCH